MYKRQDADTARVPEALKGKTGYIFKEWNTKEDGTGETYKPVSYTHLDVYKRQVCWGSCQGVIGENEVLISTGTRNFKGRAGHPSSKVPMRLRNLTLRFSLGSSSSRDCAQKPSVR